MNPIVAAMATQAAGKGVDKAFEKDGLVDKTVTMLSKEGGFMDRTLDSCGELAAAQVSTMSKISHLIGANIDIATEKAHLRKDRLAMEREAVRAGMDPSVRTVAWNQGYGEENFSISMGGDRDRFGLSMISPSGEILHVTGGPGFPGSPYKAYVRDEFLGAVAKNGLGRIAMDGGQSSRLDGMTCVQFDKSRLLALCPDQVKAYELERKRRPSAQIAASSQPLLAEAKEVPFVSAGKSHDFELSLA